LFELLGEGLLEIPEALSVVEEAAKNLQIERSRDPHLRLISALLLHPLLKSLREDLVAREVQLSQLLIYLYT
jgi:hypothetical protein